MSAVCRNRGFVKYGISDLYECLCNFDDFEYIMNVTVIINRTKYMLILRNIKHMYLSNEVPIGDTIHGVWCGDANDALKVSSSGINVIRISCDDVLLGLFKYKKEITIFKEFCLQRK